MSPIEIIFAVIGVLFLIGSCLCVKDETVAKQSLELSDEIVEAQKKEAERLVQQVLDEKVEDAVVKTDDYLSKVSNEKIMAVNDFTDQILEKIKENHKEVVFLYDMLNKKEDEIKQLAAKLKKTETEVAKKVTVSEKKTEVKSEAKAETKKKETVKPVVEVPKEVTSNTYDLKNDGQLEFVDMMQSEGKKEEIIKLYKQGKSILEISKALGMGQGEVKLIVGLYGL